MDLRTLAALAGAALLVVSCGGDPKPHPPTAAPGHQPAPAGASKNPWLSAHHRPRWLDPFSSHPKESPRSVPRQGFFEAPDRELESLQWAAQGKTIQETADVLCISARTAEKQLESAVSQLGAANKTNAVALGITRGLISL